MCHWRVPLNATNRLLLLICDTPRLINVLIRKYNLPETDAFKQYITNVTEKLNQVDREFLQTPAVTQNKWKDALNEDRHNDRHRVHGLHHKICDNKVFHAANDICTRTLCGRRASQYHILNCTMNTAPLCEYAQ